MKSVEIPVQKNMSWLCESLLPNKQKIYNVEVIVCSVDFSSMFPSKFQRSLLIGNSIFGPVSTELDSVESRRILTGQNQIRIRRDAPRCGQGRGHETGTIYIHRANKVFSSLTVTCIHRYLKKVRGQNSRNVLIIITTKMSSPNLNKFSIYKTSQLSLLIYDSNQLF